MLHLVVLAFDEFVRRFPHLLNVILFYFLTLTTYLFISYFIIQTKFMSWYGNYNDASKELDALIDKKPTLQDLLKYNDFVPQLKAFNPKLLDYITNSKQIPKEILNYICVPPTDQDSSDRQYKLPLLTIQMIETETTCIINSLLKENQTKTGNYLSSTFQLLRGEEVLPILGGYFVRTHEAMLRARYRQTIQTMYKHPQNFDLLIKHCQHQTISTCLQLYLNLEFNKEQYLSQQKTSTKVQVIKKILNKIDLERKKGTTDSSIKIENLIVILNETIDKYYLIADGKLMLEMILDEKPVAMILEMISKNSSYSSSAMQLCLYIMKYYSFSSFNTEEQNEEINKKNMERLQSQPFIIKMNKNFSLFLNQIKTTPIMTLYHYKLLEVLSHCVALSSIGIFNTIKEAHFYQTLIDLMFKHENCSILHKLIERSFLHIFEANKKIYEIYKRHLFCEVSIIQLTGKRVIDTYTSPQSFKIIKKKGYFGLLIRIIKIYSGIQTLDKDIREAITSKAELWNKLNKIIMKPYQNITKDELGTLTNVPPSKEVEFTVKKNLEITPNMINNSKVIEEIKKEETMQNLKSLEAKTEEKKEEKNVLEHPKLQDDTFFKVPIEESLERKNSEGTNQNKSDQKIHNKKEEEEKHSDSEENKSKEQRFKEFMLRKKKQTGDEIKLQRSQSSERKLSAGKRTRMASPSPNRKKNSWKDDENQKEEKTKPRIQFTKDLPKIPMAHPTNKLSQSAVVGDKKQNENELNTNVTKSMLNLEDLKKITVVKVVGPQHKKFRRIEDKDKILLGYLGINL